MTAVPPTYENNRKKTHKERTMETTGNTVSISGGGTGIGLAPLDAVATLDDPGQFLLP